MDVEPQVAFFGDNVPLLLKGLARVGDQGAYGNAYVCDLNLFGFFPWPQRRGADHRQCRDARKQSVQHTPRCRNVDGGQMADSSVWPRLGRHKKRPLENYNTLWLRFRRRDDRSADRSDALGACGGSGIQALHRCSSSRPPHCSQVTRSRSAAYRLARSPA